MLVILHCSYFSESMDHLKYSEYEADLLFSIENKYILWLCFAIRAWAKHVLSGNCHSSFFVNLNEMDTVQLCGSKQYWSFRPCKRSCCCAVFQKKSTHFCSLNKLISTLTFTFFYFKISFTYSIHFNISFTCTGVLTFLLLQNWIRFTLDIYNLFTFYLI